MRSPLSITRNTHAFQIIANCLRRSEFVIAAFTKCDSFKRQHSLPRKVDINLFRIFFFFFDNSTVFHFFTKYRFIYCYYFSRRQTTISVDLKTTGNFRAAYFSD